MSNIKNYNISGIDYRLSNSEYYDFYLCTDAPPYLNISGHGDFHNLDFNHSDFDVFSNPTDSLITGFNFKDYSTNQVPQITGSTVWDNAISDSFSASTYGLTGLDNGSIPYSPELDNFNHDNLLNILTGSTLVHTTYDTILRLNRVTGYTGNIIYPSNLIINQDDIGNYISLCGGFYQGYYKLDGFNYQVMPNRYENGWTIDTWLNRADISCSGTTGTTLNDLYPNNKGFFYYIGTRSENKFWNIFSGNTSSGCTSGSSNFCMDVKEIDVHLSDITVEGKVSNLSVPLSPPPIDIKVIKNQFLIFGRSNGMLCSHTKSKDGFGQVRADRFYDKNTIHYSSIVREHTTNHTNPFLIFGRSNGVLCNHERSEDGFGQVRADRNFSGMTTPILELDKEADIIDNALGFRIKDDGSIGYRLLTVSADCKNVEVIEEYSMSGAVSPDKWEHITVKWVNNKPYNGCDLINAKPRRGKFKFYVNSMLIFSSKELNEFIPKRLDDLFEKQIGVPYNISIGGGSQGLLESMTFDGQDSDDLGLIIERNFAGTFIGYISNFNFYSKNLSWCEIKKLYNNNKEIYL